MIPRVTLVDPGGGRILSAWSFPIEWRLRLGPLVLLSKKHYKKQRRCRPFLPLIDAAPPMLWPIQAQPIQATAARDAHGRVLINDMTDLSKESPVINDTTDLSEGSPVINNTSTITTWVKGRQLSTIRNQYKDDSCGQWPMWSMTYVVNDRCGQWLVWLMTYVVDDLCGHHLTLCTTGRNGGLQME